MTVYPVVERTAQVIVSRLAAITVSNGYHQNVAGVVRWTRFPQDSPDDKTLWLLQGDRIRNDQEADKGSNFVVSWDQTWLIVCFISPSDKDTTPQDQLMNWLLADVQKALTNDPSWYQFADTSGHTSIYAEMREASVARSLEGASVTMELMTRYRTYENDPYTAA